LRSPFIKLVALAATAVAALATSASAQYRGRGGFDRERADSALALPPRPAPGVAALVLDHSADFALTDSQRVMLESIRHTQDSANGPWLQKLKALRPTGQPANGPADLSQEQRDEIAARRAAIAEAVEGMRESNAEARQRTMALLTPEQQKKAAQLEEEARKKAQESGPDRSGSGDEGRQRRGGGRGMGGGMGRPPED
jgi:regulator of protease activity HflC (stomatin/prohibitin superfamily)